ncbi:MAG: hypothetical protein IJP64_02105 [Oscillospiraceae bacterium]|nr:hypothetical protein [Oscillospiraceae bacterium]
MKGLGKLLFFAVALALVIGAIVLVVKIVKGALNTILGVMVIIALIVIVIWMLSYASRARRK